MQWPLKMEGEAVGAFDDFESRARELLGTAVQIPDLMMNLGRSLVQHYGDIDAAATDDLMVRSWAEFAVETRSAVLMQLAWASKDVDLAAPEDTAELYAKCLHTYARDLDGDVEAFAGTTFPHMPFPGQAGALASWIGFDHDDRAGLKAALILMALMQQRMEAARDFGSL